MASGGTRPGIFAVSASFQLHLEHVTYEPAACHVIFGYCGRPGNQVLRNGTQWSWDARLQWLPSLEPRSLDKRHRGPSHRTGYTSIRAITSPTPLPNTLNETPKSRSFPDPPNAGMLLSGSMPLPQQILEWKPTLNLLVRNLTTRNTRQGETFPEQRCDPRLAFLRCFPSSEHRSLLTFRKSGRIYC